MITPYEAEQCIRAHLPAYPVVTLSLADTHGQILRECVTADRDLPPYDRVTMDGIAIRYAAWQSGRRTFALEHTAAAGQPVLPLTDPDTGCVQVMTGAMLPTGSDTVVPYEDLAIENEQATIQPSARIAPLQNLHSRGSDRRAGDPVLQPGQVLHSPQISIAAAVGRTTLQVAERPSVAILSTGDELRDVEDDVEPWHIRSANDRGIRAALLNDGYARVERFHITDDLDATTALLGRLLETFGALILTGGVSMGKRDYVPAALMQLGVRECFHKVRQKPGKPMWFGLHPGGCPVFALPGNTVSSLVCLHRYVLPGLNHALGASPAPLVRVKLKSAMRFMLPLTGFIPVRLEWDNEGLAWALAMETNTSGDFAALSDSDGFIELPDTPDVFNAGHPVTYQPWK